jgi:hypothetical protein
MDLDFGVELEQVAAFDVRIGDRFAGDPVGGFYPRVSFDLRRQRLVRTPRGVRDERPGSARFAVMGARLSEQRERGVVVADEWDPRDRGAQPVAGALSWNRKPSSAG